MSSPVPAGTRQSRRLSTLTRAAARALADAVMPPVCLACHGPLAAHDSLCARCWSGIAFIRQPLCDRLGIPLPFDPGGPGTGPHLSAAALADPPDYDRARAVAQFSGVMRDLVHALKYADRHDARRLFGRWITQAAAELIDDADVLIPVPLHPYRLLARRFNQSAILAHELARHSGLPVDPLALQRRRRTISQVGLTRDQRRQNLRGAFAVPPDGAGRILGKSVLLVDDVITTGTTVNACARQLKRAGAARVDVVALALVTNASRVNP